MTLGDRARVLVVVAGALASIATPAPRYSYPRNYPEWRIAGDPTLVRSCAEIRAWISKSGKQGVGLTIRAAPIAGRAEPCDVVVRSARFVIDGTPHAIGGAPATRHGAHQYVAFAFDNEALWNDRLTTGRVSIALEVQGVEGPEWTLPLEHVWTGPHKRVENVGEWRRRERLRRQGIAQ